ncbi:MAG: TlpA family protein disulfide reductase [Spirochaetia bacterium]|nr:TlpA family protein disulfide reductase [Spirochaetia bacterium]
MIRVTGICLLICLGFINVFSEEMTSLKNLEGKSVNLSEYPSKLIVVNFWAVWCKPCVEEFPELNQLFQRLKDRGIFVVGVSISPSKDDIENFLEKHKIDFPILIDEQERFANQFKVSILPTTILMDNEHNILYKYQGFSKKELMKMESFIENYLKR